MGWTQDLIPSCSFLPPAWLGLDGPRSEARSASRTFLQRGHCLGIPSHKLTLASGLYPGAEPLGKPPPQVSKSKEEREAPEPPSLLLKSGPSARQLKLGRVVLDRATLT